MFMFQIALKKIKIWKINYNKMINEYIISPFEFYSEGAGLSLSHKEQLEAFEMFYKLLDKPQKVVERYYKKISPKDTLLDSLCFRFNNKRKARYVAAYAAKEKNIFKNMRGGDEIF